MTSRNDKAHGQVGQGAEARTDDNASVPKSASNNQAIAKVIADQHDLSAYGYKFTQCFTNWNDGEEFEAKRAEMFSDDFAEQVRTVRVAISATLQRDDDAWSINRRGSYHLKHAVEAWVKRHQRSDLAPYITNGAFIVGAILAGWVPVRWTNSPNCGFRRASR
jgi:hypothetical protein